MDIDNYSEDDVNRILSLFYSYGLITFGNDYHSMCISNNLIFHQFLERQGDFSHKNSVTHSLTEFLRNPMNSNNLKKALKLIFKLETLRDNSFSESALQSLIESNLKTVHKINNFQVNFVIVDTSGNKDYSKRIDIKLSSPEEEQEIILELKMMKPNSIILPNFQLKNEEEGWFDSDFRNQQALLDELEKKGDWERKKNLCLI